MGSGLSVTNQFSASSHCFIIAGFPCNQEESNQLENHHDPHDNVSVFSHERAFTADVFLSKDTEVSCQDTSDWEN